MKHTVSTILLCAAAALALGCSKHDPSYDDITRPEVKADKSVISGVVTNFKGEPIAGADIQMNFTGADGQSISATVKTDDKGQYVYTLENAALYDMVASASGYNPRQGQVRVPTLETSAVYIKNFVLPKTMVIILKTGENEADTETIDKNEVKGIIHITSEVIIEEGSLPEGAKLYLVPIYSKFEGEYFAENGIRQSTKASVKVENKMLVGCSLACSDASIVKFSIPATMTYSVNKETQENTKFLRYDRASDKWVNQPYTSFEDHIETTITDLTSYGFFADVTETLDAGHYDIEFTTDPASERYTKDERLWFRWDNIYGSAPLHVNKADYVYHLGVILDQAQAQDNQLRALLLEKLAQDLGIREDNEVDATYHIGIDLPVGTGLAISGQQATEELEYSMVTKEQVRRAVSAHRYGNVGVGTKSFNRIHTGGGGNN